MKVSGKKTSRKNKGEWSEFLSFVKLLQDEKLALADVHLNPTGVAFKVRKVTTRNIAYDCLLEKNCEIVIASKLSNKKRVVLKKDIISQDMIDNIISKIKAGRRTFDIPEFVQIEKALGFAMNRGGNSHQKADIILDVKKEGGSTTTVGFGIKSYLGGKPSLLNASRSTNFIYKVSGLTLDKMDEINNIKTRHKLTDRLERIYALGGELIFSKSEKETLEYNLKRIDPMMPEIMSAMLYEYFINRSSRINKNIKKIHARGALNKKINYGNLDNLISKVKRLLVATLLGFFPSEKWDGKYKVKGLIVVRKSGKQVAFHLQDRKLLEDYLFKKIRFDTSSTKRHRYGSLLTGKGDELFFKLNLSLRF